MVESLRGGRFYLVREGLTYQLDRYPSEGYARIVDPDALSGRTYGVRRDIDGRWQPIQDSVAPGAEGADAAQGVAAATADAPERAAHAPHSPTARGGRGGPASPMQGHTLSRIADHVQYYLEPGVSLARAAADLGVSEAQVRTVERHIRIAERSWSRMQDVQAPRATVIVAPLTSREKQFVLNWRDRLFSNCLAELMGRPPEVIDAFIAANSPVASRQPAGAGASGLPRRVGQDGVPADAVLAVVRRYALRPRRSSAAIAAEAGLPRETVQRIRNVSARATLEWLAMRQAEMDVAALRGEDMLSPAARAFVNVWHNELPLHTLLQIVSAPRANAAPAPAP